MKAFLNVMIVGYLIFAVLMGTGYAVRYLWPETQVIVEVPAVQEVEVEAVIEDEPITYTAYSMDMASLKVELRQFKQCDFHYLDETYYYTDYTTVSDLLVSIEMPEFVPETWDCDDIALYLKIEMARLYGLNCVGYAEGDHLGFYHAWNIVLTTDGIYTWEGELQQWNNESWYDASLIWF